MPAETVFLDANGLVALINADDWLHDEATRTFEEIGRQGCSVVTTHLALAEFANSLARTPARGEAATFIRDILREPRARVVFVDAELFLLGLRRYEAYTDKEWGLVDCISFELMRREGIRQAFSADHHFEQAGYRCLLPHR